MNTSDQDIYGTLEISEIVGIPREGRTVKAKRVITLRLRSVTLAEANAFVTKFRDLNPHGHKDYIWRPDPIYIR